MKLKFITAFTISLLLVIISIGAVPARANDSDPIKLKAMAKGTSHWPPSTEVSIITEVRYLDGEPNLGDIIFHHKRYDEVGEKVWSLMGKLSDGIVNTEEWLAWYDQLSGLVFFNLMYISGLGQAKYFPHAAEKPYSQYFEAFIGCLVCPPGWAWNVAGEYYVEVPGWSWAAIFLYYDLYGNPVWDGSSTDLTLYKEIYLD